MDIRVMLKMIKYMSVTLAFIAISIVGVKISEYLTGDGQWWTIMLFMFGGIYALYQAAKIHVDVEREREKRIADRLSRDD